MCVHNNYNILIEWHVLQKKLPDVSVVIRVQAIPMALALLKVRLDTLSIVLSQGLKQTLAH
jgi:hypothetical protein